MISILEVKKAITVQLKKVRDIDVLFVTAEKTDSHITEQKIDEFYFVSLIPISNRLFGKDQRDKVFLIDIAYISNKCTNNDYFIWSEEMEQMFLPVLKIGNRNITIEESTFRIVDEVGHFGFSLKFRDLITDKDSEDAPVMDASEIDLKLF